MNTFITLPASYRAWFIPLRSLPLRPRDTNKRKYFVTVIRISKSGMLGETEPDRWLIALLRSGGLTIHVSNYHQRLVDGLVKGFATPLGVSNRLS